MCSLLGLLMTILTSNPGLSFIHKIMSSSIKARATGWHVTTIHDAEIYVLGCPVHIHKVFMEWQLRPIFSYINTSPFNAKF